MLNATTNDDGRCNSSPIQSIMATAKRYFRYKNIEPLTGRRYHLTAIDGPGGGPKGNARSHFQPNSTGFLKN